MSRRKCVVCREREAVLPDRDRAPSMIRRICRPCHQQKRLDVIAAKVKNARLDWALQSDEPADLIEDLAFVLGLIRPERRDNPDEDFAVVPDAADALKGATRA